MKMGHTIWHYRVPVPNQGAVAPWVLLMILSVPQTNTFFNTSLKILFSKCHQTLKQIAMHSPVGATNYISLL